MPIDSISRIICDELNLRAYTVVTLETVQEITGYHKTTPNATYALGRTITASALLAASLKPDSSQSLSIKFSGNGPIAEIQVQVDALGNVRGYISNPQVDLNHDIGGISFTKCIGAAVLNVTKNLSMEKPYSSILPLSYGEVASDIAYYLTFSEQVPSALILGLKLNSTGAVTASGGVLVQTFPETDISVIENVEKNIQKKYHDLGESLARGEDIYVVLSEIFDNKPMKVLDTRPIRAACRCSKEVVASAFKAISKNEIEDMMKKDRGAEIICTFCRKVYNFTEEELGSILHLAGDQ